MRKTPVQWMLIALLCAALAYSFWFSRSWLQLCYGLALFLFGMQCIEEGLSSAAGGTLERLMANSTATAKKGLLFGVTATFVLQSSTLVSLLTIAFLSAGLISLAGGIAIVLGTNLGATSGIWLLAMVGQSISLSPVALPMLVFGILAGFFSSKAKALGRVLVGIALIFLAIDAIKNGFQALGGQVDFTHIQVSGWAEVAIFTGLGFLLTLVLQSSHATLILTLAALSGGQISIMQGFAIAIGSNVGSSASTAFVGMFSSERNGQRLALAHLLFNCVTAVLSLLLWLPLTRTVSVVAAWLGLNGLLQLALFHTLFNVLGIAVFWRIQPQLAAKLNQWLPDKNKQPLLPDDTQAYRPQYLNENMLRSDDTAILAVFKEIRRLNDLGLEIVCHALFVDPAELNTFCRKRELPPPNRRLELNVQAFYDGQIKPLYSDILAFASRVDTDSPEYAERLGKAYQTAFRIAEIIKESKHLQKNMYAVLSDTQSPLYPDYVQLREQLTRTLCLFNQALQLPPNSVEWVEKQEKILRKTEDLEAIRQNALEQLRRQELDGRQVSSLMNDIHYARFIAIGLGEILHQAGADLAA